GGEELLSELSVALQRSLLSGKSGTGSGLDLSSLIVEEGNICWDLYIDTIVVSSDGNLLDVFFAAIKFDTTGLPVIVYRQYIADATSQEESLMSLAVSFAINRHGHICFLTKWGNSGLDPSVILEMVSVSKDVSEQLMMELDSEISAVEHFSSIPDDREDSSSQTFLLVNRDFEYSDRNY
ncbi:hypothetical protein MKW94_006523, partial [Papaver nudicaule]|nr:hypothetical protein [Papaver nudicaule]